MFITLTNASEAHKGNKVSVKISEIVLRVVSLALSSCKRSDRLGERPDQVFLLFPAVFGTQGSSIAYSQQQS